MMSNYGRGPINMNPSTLPTKTISLDGNNQHVLQNIRDIFPIVKSQTTGGALVGALPAAAVSGMPVNLQWEIHVFQNPTSEIPTPPSASASNDGDPDSLEIAALVCSLLHVDEAVAAKPGVAADALKIQIGQCRPLARAAILAALLSGTQAT